MLVFECRAHFDGRFRSVSRFSNSGFFSLPLFIHLYKEESSSAGELSNVGFSHIYVLRNQTSLLSSFIM